MEYRINKQGLLDRISAWDSFVKRKVYLIACSGTAMTLLDVKASTKDIDLLVPNEDEHKYLINILQQLGYKSASGWRQFHPYYSIARVTFEEGESRFSQRV